MKSYVALLRGIMPQNPNMRSEKLRNVFDNLGYLNVRSVIGSGNILFETNNSSAKMLEEEIEQALTAQLGITSTTIIRSRDELIQLVEHNPFKDVDQSKNNYLTVTFFKNKSQTDLHFPYQPKNKSFTLLRLYDREICCVTDLTEAKTPDLMAWLEKEFSKQITTRTYKTVGRIMDRF